MQIHKHRAKEVDVLDYTGQARLDGSTKRSTALHDWTQCCFCTAASLRTNLQRGDQTQRVWQAGSATNQEPRILLEKAASCQPIHSNVVSSDVSHMLMVLSKKLNYSKTILIIVLVMFKAKMPNLDLFRRPNFEPWLPVICSMNLSWISLDFGLFDRQNQQFENVTFGSAICAEQVMNSWIKKIMIRLIDTENNC